MHRRIADVMLAMVMLAAILLGLAGCRRTETRATVTPAQTPASQQSLPVVGGESTPLPTAAIGESPIQP
jgi:uncharacterized lipoprotein YajG